jgi:hypothetical protein
MHHSNVGLGSRFLSSFTFKLASASTITFATAAAMLALHQGKTTTYVCVRFCVFMSADCFCPKGTRHGFQGNLHISHRSVYLLHMMLQKVTAEIVQMILQLALRLEELHSLGYVHRDLKPGNVMWLPRENRWTVIDFGCVARTGESARLGFSIKYAAPEVIAAYRKGAQTIVAQVFHFYADILVLNQECCCRNAQVCSLSVMERYMAAK